MNGPKTIGQSLAQLRGLLLDWTTPPQTTIWDAFKGATVTAVDFATTKAGAITIGVTAGVSWIVSLVTALLVAWIRNLNSNSDYWDAARRVLEGS